MCCRSSAAADTRASPPLRAMPDYKQTRLMSCLRGWFNSVKTKMKRTSRPEPNQGFCYKSLSDPNQSTWACVLRIASCQILTVVFAVRLTMYHTIRTELMRNRPTQLTSQHVSSAGPLIYGPVLFNAVPFSCLPCTNRLRRVRNIPNSLPGFHISLLRILPMVRTSRLSPLS